MAKRLLFVSKSIEPHFNLAFENWLIQDAFKAADSPDLLFIYQNRPSIIIGRNQNVWAECNVKEANGQGIPILRRYSGGGTVYHDLGNTNYSFHCAKSLFNRTAAAEMIIRALKEHSDTLFLSPRHDIFIKRSNGSTAKVSGSAYKLSRDRAYHHGTLLLSTKLEKIGTLLKSPLKVLKDETFKFGGVSSVPSPVANIGLSFDLFFELIHKEFNPTESVIEVNEHSNSNNGQIEQYKKELESWNWTFGKSPPFKTITKNSALLLVESGLIKESTDPLFLGRPFDFDLINSE